MHPCSDPLTRKLIQLALEEDRVHADLSSELTVPEGLRGMGTIITRESCVVCGMPLVEEIVREAGFRLQVELHREDGDRCEPGEQLLVLSGAAAQILAVERTILNFLQRLCGIATHAAALQQEAAELILLDTRKTTPGWRVIEKYAVRTGGAQNHRMNLEEQILIKDNHLNLATGGVTEVLKRVKERKPTSVRMEVEARSLEELEEVLPSEPDMILLDNLSDEELAEAVTRIRSIRPTTLIEASGRISSDRFAALRAAGVNAASMGALTYGASVIDLSLRLEEEKR